MKKVVFAVFTFVYIATALATLVAFLVQARIIPTDLPANAEIPYLGVLISAVLVETVVGYIAIAKDLFGIRATPGGGQMAGFGNSICGGWWEQIKPDTPSALSYVEITPDTTSGTLKMKGDVYGPDGNRAAFWESEAVCIKASDAKLFYYWKGWHPDRANEPYEGFGEISFNSAENGAINSGFGFFSDTNLTQIQSTTKKSVTLTRCKPDEVKVFQHDSDKEKQILIMSKLHPSA